MTPYVRTVAIEAKIDLVPLMQTLLSEHPLPHQGPISDWYWECQQWFIKNHQFRPARPMIQDCLQHMNYRHVWMKGQRNWVPRKPAG